MAEQNSPPKVPPRIKPKGRDKYDTRHDIVQFITNEEGFTMQQMYDEFSDKLPVFAMVTQGCLGLSDLTTFSVEQTMFCKAFVQQTRVIARDARDRTISIPINYPLPFRVVHSRNKVGEQQKLSEILDEHKFPVQVRFSVPGDSVLSINENTKRVKDLTNLLLVDTFQETFLVANGVYGKYLEPKSMIVPMYLDDLQLSTVTGAVGVSQKEWGPWYEDLLEAIKKVELLPDMGNKDITVFSGKLPYDTEDHVYDYIKPSEIISFSHLNATDDEKYTSPKLRAMTEKAKTLANELKSTLKLGDHDGKSKEEDLKKKKLINRSDSESTLNQTTPPRLPPRSTSQKARQARAFHGSGGTTPKREHHSRDTSHFENLTISGFSEILKQLKMEKHIEKFRKCQVDGELAKDLTEIILKDDFRLSEFEILKLMKFINFGHIPK